MLRYLLKQRFNTSQSNTFISTYKSSQKIVVENEFNKAIEYKNKLEKLNIDTCFIDEYWSYMCNDILSIYDDVKSFSQFGQNKVIISTMIGDPVRNMYASFKGLINFAEEEDLLEEWFGNFRINVPNFHSTGQRLGHIYIANLIREILKAENRDLITVNEIGGGFGGLAKTLEKRIKAQSYTIIDLWQILPLQRAYLNLTRNDNVTDYGFVPVQDSFSVREANVFISNWALTEATMEMQQYVVDLEFFGAKHVFIACQSNNKNHYDGRYLHEYLNSNSKLNLDLKGPMSDSKLYYLRMR